jgi:hypothetical protein
VVTGFWLLVLLRRAQLDGLVSGPVYAAPAVVVLVGSMVPAYGVTRVVMRLR